MYENERDKWREQCDKNGISWARAILPNRVEGIQEHLREWINEYDLREQARREAEQIRMSEEAIRAAQSSAKTSRDAAEASKRSALWTMVAAIAAAASAAIPLAQAFGYLPRP